jgi:translation initiation factor IF-3
MLVIGTDGQSLGVISKAEALNKAREAELDLVEIAPQANPPVAKIVDFQKFKYEESKKEQAAKKNAKDVELKEIWLTPRIAEHDLNTRLNRVEEFLADGNRIMFRVKFKGREMAHPEFGFQLLDKIFASLEGKINIEREPKMEGRSITVIIGRYRGGNNKPEEEKINEDQTEN